MLEKKYLRRWFPSGFLYTKFKHSFIYFSNPELSNLRPFFNNNIFQQYNNFRHKSVNHNFHFITSLVSGIERGKEMGNRKKRGNRKERGKRKERGETR